jgi:hypothetical protein
MQQIEYRQQARFGTDEIALPQAVQPRQRSFGRSSEIVVGLILASRIIFAEPAAFVGGPIVELRGRRLGEKHVAGTRMQVIQVVVQLRR